MEDQLPLRRKTMMRVAVIVILAALPATGFPSVQRVIDDGLFVRIETVGGRPGNGIVVGEREIATHCGILAGAVSVTVHEVPSRSGFRGSAYPAIVAAHDVASGACLLVLDEPFWSVSPPGLAPLAGSAVDDGTGVEFHLLHGASESKLERSFIEFPNAAPDRALHRMAAEGSFASAVVLDAEGRLAALFPPEVSASQDPLVAGREVSEGHNQVASVRAVRELLTRSADWRRCLLHPAPDCVLDQAARVGAGASWAVSLVRDAYTELGNRAGALLLVEEAVAHLRTSGGADPRIWLSASVWALDLGKQDEAVELLGEARTAARGHWKDDAYWRIDFLVDVAERYVQAGLPVVAAEVADEALNLASDVDRDLHRMRPGRPDPRERALGAAARVQPGKNRNLQLQRPRVLRHEVGARFAARQLVIGAVGERRIARDPRHIQDHSHVERRRFRVELIRADRADRTRLPGRRCRSHCLCPPGSSGQELLSRVPTTGGAGAPRSFAALLLRSPGSDPRDASLGSLRERLRGVFGDACRLKLERVRLHAAPDAEHRHGVVVCVLQRLDINVDIEADLAILLSVVVRHVAAPWCLVRRDLVCPGDEMNIHTAATERNTHLPVALQWRV